MWRMKSANCGEVNCATLAAAYRYLFPDFICQSITIAQRIKSLVRTHVYYFVYRYSNLFSRQRLFTADLKGDQYNFSPFASTWGDRF